MSDTRAIIEERDLTDLLHYLETYAKIRDEVFAREALKLIDRVRIMQRTQPPLAFVDADKVPWEVRSQGKAEVKRYVEGALAMYAEQISIEKAAVP